MAALKQGYRVDRNGLGRVSWTCTASPAVHVFLEEPSGQAARTLRGRRLREDEMRMLQSYLCPVCALRHSGPPAKDGYGITLAVLANLDIFHTLDRRMLAQVARIAHIVQLPEGTVLAKQDDMGDRIYGILEGSVQLTIDSGQGEITVRVAGPGECLPIAALLGERALITTAYAMTDLQVVEIPEAPLRSVLQGHPRVGHLVYRAVAEILAARYRRTLGRLMEVVDAKLMEPEFSANL